MIQAIEVQVISKILTCDDDSETLDTLLSYAPDLYFQAYRKEIEYIHEQKHNYNIIPSTFNFLAQFPDFNIVQVPEPLEYLTAKLREYRQRLLLIETFNKIKDLGDGDVSQAWQYLSVQCDAAEMLGQTAPMDIVKDAQKRADQIKEYSKQKRIPTGFPEIDKLMYGGLSTVEELLVLVARTNSGKAQPLDRKVLTPHGWIRMGDIKVGDIIVGENNDNGKVVKIFPQGSIPSYKVTFDDNTFTECCDDHLWKVLDAKRRDPRSPLYGRQQVLTLKEMRRHFYKHYSVDVITDPVEFEETFDKDKELDPYMLGFLLGSCRPSSWQFGPNDVVGMRGKIYRKSTVTKMLFDYQLLDDNFILWRRSKFIPKQFLTAPVDMRKELLAGLVDANGQVTEGSKGCWEFETRSEQLCKDFAELARSLGVWVRIDDRSENKKDTHSIKIWHLSCKSIFNPFHRSTESKKYVKIDESERFCKMIKSIEYSRDTECQCIMLDNDSHTYLTDDYIVTHNTWVCVKMMESAQKNGFPVAYYSPEMQSAFLGTRFDTWRGHFENSKLFRGDYSQEYYAYLKSLPSSNTSAFVIEDKDFPDGVSVRTLDPFVKKHGIKLLIIDGISYMNDDQRAIRDQEKYKNIALGLFKLSKKYGCAVVLVMQANREVKSKDDKGESVPTLYNAEGSDQPGRIATQAFGIRQIFDKHVLDIGLLKSRTADNRNPVFSYAWDINTGQTQYIPNDDSDSSSLSPTITPAASMSAPNLTFANNAPTSSDLSLLDDDDDLIEF